MKTPSTPSVSCPCCGAAVAWTADSQYRPFCSARCKGIDLGAWASGEYRIATPRAESAPDADTDD